MSIPSSIRATLRRRFGGTDRGQVLPIFVVMSVVLLGAAALVSDVAWWWTNEQRAQRAADAGALAGAIFLPGDQDAAFAAAFAETAKNGFTNGANGVRVTPLRDAGDPRKLLVDIDANVGTFFARVFCWDGGPCLANVPLSVTGAATYVLPVPMGSPQNYYGVGHFVDAVTPDPVPHPNQVIERPPTNSTSGNWSNANSAFGSGATTEGSDNDTQSWNGFSFGSIPNSATITGIRVLLDGVRVEGGSGDQCRLTVDLSWNNGNGSSWTSALTTAALTTSDANYQVPQTPSLTAWGTHPWTRAEVASSNFRVRLRWDDNFTGCSSGRSVRVDDVDVEVTYDWTETFPPVIEETDVLSPDDDILAPQNFWGALQSQGAPNIQGDAYMTYYDTRTSRTNGDYRPDSYYQYAVEFPPDSSAGEVWVFDPGFCEVDTNRGTGEDWTVGGANGNGSAQPVSTYYRLYDTNETPFNTDDDEEVGTSGDQFRRLFRSDHDLADDPESNTNCANDNWHNDWWQIGTNLEGGKTYRLHTFSTDPGSATDQRSTTALNGFAIWAKARDGTPRVHGLGAMEAYVRLPGGRKTEFYLARIDAEHAGKTMIIRLWDPGDTGQLAADLQILQPTDHDYEPINFRYTAERGSGASSDCGDRRGTNVSFVTTNPGGGSNNSRFNGCWLTIEILLDREYDAPHPSSDLVTDEGGWWKIVYDMDGDDDDYSTDLTTWQVELRGSPVHLVLE